ncbi:MAG: serine hydrolase [SAR324 cluster bacterium]|nr:serine hydrolase [SAR324 cluster bacterium]
MKKKCILLLFICFVPVLGNVFSTYADTRSLFDILDTQDHLFGSLLLIDADTGQTLYAHNPDSMAIPASTVKLMTALITLEKIESGQLHLDDKVVISQLASHMGGSQVFLKEGEVFTLSELLKAMIMVSANDAAVAIAEYAGGSYQDFVALMNKKAAQLGMDHSLFFTPHGLPPKRGMPDNMTTARDLSRLAQEVLKHPVYMEYASTKVDSFRNGEFQLVSTYRKMLQTIDGMDGLKSGYHRKAGFNFVGTAKRGNTRLISVVTGCENRFYRDQFTIQLLTAGFEQFERTPLFSEGSLIDQGVPVEDGLEPQVDLEIGQSLSLLVTPGTPQVDTRLEMLSNVRAPVEKGEVLGYLDVYLNDRLYQKIPLKAHQSVKQSGFLDDVANSLLNWNKYFFNN